MTRSPSFMTCQPTQRKRIKSGRTAKGQGVGVTNCGALPRNVPLYFAKDGLYVCKEGLQHRKDVL